MNILKCMYMTQSFVSVPKKILRWYKISINNFSCFNILSIKKFTMPSSLLQQVHYFFYYLVSILLRSLCLNPLILRKYESTPNSVKLFIQLGHITDIITQTLLNFRMFAEHIHPLVNRTLSLC